MTMFTIWKIFLYRKKAYIKNLLKPILTNKTKKPNKIKAHFAMNLSVCDNNICVLQLFTQTHKCAHVFLLHHRSISSKRKHMYHYHYSNERPVKHFIAFVPA